MYVACQLRITPGIKDKRVIAVSESVESLKEVCQNEQGKQIVWKKFMGFWVSEAHGGVHEWTWYNILEVKVV